MKTTDEVWEKLTAVRMVLDVLHHPVGFQLSALELQLPNGPTDRRLQLLVRKFV